MENKVYTIDANNRMLGRVATEAAVILRGKNSAAFQPNVAPRVTVKIANLDKVKLSGRKLQNKNYKRYSGYPGGLKIVKFESLFGKDPKKVFRHVVRGMLPNNKLRAVMLKNLIVE